MMDEEFIDGSNKMMPDEDDGFKIEKDVKDDLSGTDAVPAADRITAIETHQLTDNNSLSDIVSPQNDVSFRKDQETALFPEPETTETGYHKEPESVFEQTASAELSPTIPAEEHLQPEPEISAIPELQPKIERFSEPETAWLPEPETTETGYHKEPESVLEQTASAELSPTIPAEENLQPEPENTVITEANTKQEQPAESDTSYVPESKPETKSVQEVKEKASENPAAEKPATKTAQKTSEYITFAITVIIVALFFFFLGKKTSNMNKMGAAAKESFAIEEYQQTSSSNAKEKSTSVISEENENISDNTENPPAVANEAVSAAEARLTDEPDTLTSNENVQENEGSDGPWKKRTYSQDELEFISEYFKIQFPDLAVRENQLKEYILLSSISEVENILAAGMADADFIDEQGLTPLNIAVMNNNFDMCRLLIAYGANVNHDTDKLPAPLILAIGNKNEKIIKFLIDNGADVSQKYAKDGNTVIPLDAAESLGLKNSAELIRQKLAEKQTPAHK